MSNNWNTTTATKDWSALVVPVFGRATGEVCPQAYVGAGVSSKGMRHLDGITAAHKGQGPQFWSPPIT